MLRSNTLLPRRVPGGPIVALRDMSSRCVRPRDDLADVPDPPGLQLRDRLRKAVRASSPSVHGVRSDTEDMADLSGSCEELRLLHVITVASETRSQGN